MSHSMTKPTKWPVHPAKTQICHGIRLSWSESLLSAWRKFESFATHCAHSEDSDQTGRMPSLIWVFAGAQVILLVLFVAAQMRFVHYRAAKRLQVIVIDFCVMNESKAFKVCQLELFHFPFELPHDKTNTATCAPSEDSDRPGHLPSLIGVFAVLSMSSYGTQVSSCGLRRLWSDWADAQADLSLR